MNRSTPQHAEDSLDRALDAFALGDSRALDTLDRETRATLDHLFAWAALGGVNDAPPVHAAPPLSIARSRRSTPMPTTSGPAVRLAPDRPARCLVPAVWSAIAWLLIAAVAGASVYGAIPLLREDGSADLSQSVYQPETATPERVTETGEVNYGGDAGRSWHLGEVDPATGGPEVIAAIPGRQLVGSPLIFEDSLYVTAIEGAILHYLRYNLVSAKVVWESDISLIGSSASDGRRVFGFAVRNSGTNASRPVPVAISIETGELLWEGPPLIQGSDASAAGPVILDEIVYFSDVLGNMVALDAATGAVAWQYPETFTPKVTYSDADEVVGDPPEADIIATDNGIFVERPSKTIVKLDPITGVEVDSFNVIDEFGADIQQVRLQARSDRLLVSATRSEKTSLGANAPSPYRPTSILIFDTGSLDLIARSGLPEVTSNMVLTDDAIFVAGRADLAAPIGLYRIDLTSGGDGEPIHEFANTTKSWLGLSLSGSTLMVAAPDGGVAFIDRSSGNILASGEIDVESNALILSPIQMWGERPVAVTSSGSVIVFTGER